MTRTNVIFLLRIEVISRAKFCSYVIGGYKRDILHHILIEFKLRKKIWTKVLVENQLLCIYILTHMMPLR